MKAYHKRLLTVLITALLLLGLSSVFISDVFSVDATKLKIEPQGPARSTQGMNRSDGILPAAEELDADGYDTVLAKGFEQVLSDGKATLFFKEKTAEIALQDVATGHIWYSNPQDRDQETMVAGTTKLRLGAQITLTYYDSKGVYGQMDSYNDCIEYDGMTWEVQGEELVVRYHLGKTVVTLADVPQQISKSRMEQFISVLPEKDQKDLLKNYKLASITGQDQAYIDKMVAKYPNVVNEDTYYLVKDSTRILTKIKNWLDQCGYTVEDLKHDNAVNHIETEIPIRAYFDVTLAYRLDKGSLLVTLRGEELDYQETIPLHEIRVLEYFGAGGKTEKGYMLLPDGSGTLIYYNNGRVNETPVVMRLYGNDTVSDAESAYVVDKKASLPVFGIKNGKAALLTTIEQGASLVTLNARVSGMQNSYNTVFPTMQMKAVNQMRISDSQQIYFEEAPYRGDVTLRYEPLPEEDNDYMGMAKAYRQHLLDEGVLWDRTDDVYPLAVDLIGAVTTTKTVAGIPVEALEPMTTYTQMAEIAQMLPAVNEAVWLRLEGWLAGGMNQGAVTGLEAENLLGGEQGLKALLSLAEENGWILMPEVWLATAFDKDGFSVSSDCIRDLCRDVAVRYNYDYVNRYRRYGSDVIYQLDADRTKRSAEAYLAGNEQLGLEWIAVPDVGVNLWSDYTRKSPMNRELMLEAAVRVLAEVGEKVSLSMPNPNAYALAYTDRIYDLPTSDSGFRMTDESVPFYQAVVRGCIDYVSEPLNYADDHRMALLQAVEFGSGLQYTLTWQTTALLKDTEDNHINRGRYTDWVETMDESYAAAAQVLAPLAGQGMAAHERIAVNVYRTTYENGDAVVVNYGKEPVTIDHVTIPALDFALVKAGES